MNKCPKKKEKMRHPLAFHAEGKNTKCRIIFFKCSTKTVHHCIYTVHQKISIDTHMLKWADPVGI